MADFIFDDMKKIGKAAVETKFGRATLYTYQQPDHLYAFATVFGDIYNGRGVFCRVHSACITSESFFALNCDCREQLDEAFSLASKYGGIIIYLPQEGRGNGIEAKMKQMEIEASQEIDTLSAFEQSGFPIDSRTYEAASFILKDQGVLSIQIHTANPHKISTLKTLGIVIEKRIQPKVTTTNPIALRNIRAKQKKMGYFSP